jgi:hypothetical protein
MAEMKILSQLSGGLSDCPLVITHQARDPPGHHQEELEQLNDLGLRFIFGEQAKPLEF